MIREIRLKWLLIIITEMTTLVITHNSNGLNGVGINSNLLLNTRIQCEFKDKDSDSVLDRY